MLVSSLIKPFIGRQEDWKIIKLSSLKAMLRTVNASYPLAMTLYCYDNPAYFIIYAMMRPYQN